MSVQGSNRDAALRVPHFQRHIERSGNDDSAVRGYCTGGDLVSVPPQCADFFSSWSVPHSQHPAHFGGYEYLPVCADCTRIHVSFAGLQFHPLVTRLEIPYPQATI